MSVVAFGIGNVNGGEHFCCYFALSLYCTRWLSSCFPFMSMGRLMAMDGP